MAFSVGTGEHEMAPAPWQGAGGLHEPSNASEKIDSFPRRLLFFATFVLFFVGFVL